MENKRIVVADNASTDDSVLFLQQSIHSNVLKKAA
jgi:hypothetical protein